MYTTGCNQLLGDSWLRRSEANRLALAVAARLTGGGRLAGMNLNPVGLAFIGLCTVIGYLLGSWEIGLAVGLGISILSSSAR